MSYWLAQVGLLATAWLTLNAQREGYSFYFLHATPIRMFGNMFVTDALADLLKFLSCITVILTLVYSRAYLLARGLFRGETFVLMMFALLGMMVMISAASLLTLYLGLELMSLSLYALVALHRDSKPAVEAAMKYFVLGALASGLLLYGMSMVYGATGSLDLDQIARAVNDRHVNRLILVFGLVFLVSAIAFKLGAVPYHMWIPDVYEGAPTPITLFIGAAPKLAAFAFMMRLLVGALAAVAFDWQSMLLVLSLLSMILGNVVAIAQTNIKRMLAYSTIANMGFMLMGFLAAGLDGFSAAMFYAITYVLTTLAGFGIVLLLLARRLRGRPPRRFQGVEPAQSVVRVPDAPGHVLAGGRAADGRFLCQAHGVRGGDRGRTRLVRRHRRADFAGRGVLLPARRQADVLRRARRRRPDRSSRRHARAALPERNRATAVRDISAVVDDAVCGGTDATPTSRLRRALC